MMIKIRDLVMLLVGGLLGWWLYPNFYHLHKGLNVEVDPIEKSELGHQSVESMASISKSFKTPSGEKISREITKHSATHDALVLPDWKKLQNFSHWLTYQEWLSALVQIHLSESQKAWLKAQALVYYKENYIEALALYYQAIKLAENFELTQVYTKETNQFIQSAISSYSKQSRSWDNNDFYFFLEFAREKQPDFPPVSLALSYWFEAEGDLLQALDVLYLLPQGTVFDNEVQQQISRLSKIIDNDNNIQGIPLIVEGNSFLAKVIFNESVELLLLLDTGATSTALSPQAIELIASETSGLRALGETLVSTANGQVRSTVFEIANVRMGSFELVDTAVIEVNLSENGRFDGLLGMDFLANFRFRIDHQKQRLYLSDVNDNE
ncbi:MAG: retropepsin-like aspartic protease [Pseudomonadota bacterium]